MSRLLMSIAVEDAALDALGAKEAVAMALERLGRVTVMRVTVQEPEQLGFVPDPGTGRKEPARWKR